MKRMDPQLQHVLKILEDAQPHKAAAIACALGVHSRTVRRAIHRLRDEGGLTIEATRAGFILKRK